MPTYGAGAISLHEYQRSREEMFSCLPPGAGIPLPCAAPCSVEAQNSLFYVFLLC